MNISNADIRQLDLILEIYQNARDFMSKNGNAHQWAGGYPSKELIISDIEQGKLYVIECDGKIEGVFYFASEKDPAYEYIEGSWLNQLPYSVIHRVASAGNRGGILKAAVNFCLGFCDNIKTDTHENNTVMQGALSKLGFIKCGTIFLENGEKRIAYQLKK